MKKNLFRIAALALMGVCMTACSSGDDEATDEKMNPQPSNKTVTLTGTLGETVTRSIIKYNGTTTWANGDKLGIRYKKTNGSYAWAEATVTATDNAQSTATFTATLSIPEDGTVDIVYPYASRNESATSAPFYTTTALNSQDGTLETIGASKNIQTSSASMTVSDATATLNGGNPVTLTPQICIAQFNLKNKTGSSTVSASSITVNYGNTYTVNASSGSKLSTFYVAMIPQTTTSCTITANSVTGYTTGAAFDPDHTSVGEIIGRDANGNAVKLTQSPLTSVIFDLGVSTTTAGNLYETNLKAEGITVTPIAVVAYVGAVSNYCEKFIAIALEDVPTGGVTNMTEAQTAASNWVSNHGITISSTPCNTLYDHNYDVVTDNAYANVETTFANDENWAASASRTEALVKGWRIPSVTDFRYIFQGLSGTSATDPKGIVDQACHYPNNAPQAGSTTYANGETLTNAINNACGNSNLHRQYYWTSSALTGETTTKGWRFSFSRGEWEYNTTTEMSLIRPVLAY